MDILFLLFSPEAIFLGARENFPRLATRKRIDYDERYPRHPSLARARYVSSIYNCCPPIEIFALSKKRMLLRLSERPGRPCAL